MKTQAEIRKAFWRDHSEFANEYKPSKRQNEYNATIRSAFVAYIDYLQENGEITEKLAERVTL